VKRSVHITLLLLGGVSAGALTACAPEKKSPEQLRISPESVYTNDYYVEGVGYYHAPFRAFYARPYNVYDPTRGEYFFGGSWGKEPYRSVINISSPSVAVAMAAEAARDARVSRGGFGETSRSHSTWS
jgi:hypothetical protein